MRLDASGHLSPVIDSSLENLTRFRDAIWGRIGLPERPASRRLGDAHISGADAGCTAFWPIRIDRGRRQRPLSPPRCQQLQRVRWAADCSIPEAARADGVSKRDSVGLARSSSWMKRSQNRIAAERVVVVLVGVVGQNAVHPHPLQNRIVS